MPTKMNFTEFIGNTANQILKNPFLQALFYLTVSKTFYRENALRYSRYMNLMFFPYLHIFIYINNIRRSNDKGNFIHRKNFKELDS